MHISYKKDIEALGGQSSKNANTGNKCFKSITNKLTIGNQLKNNYYMLIFQMN